MTLFYSGVPNRNNKIYSHNNTNNSIKDQSSYSRMLTSSTNFTIPEYKKYGVSNRRNLNSQETITTDNSIDNSTPNPTPSMNTIIQPDNISEYFKKLVEKTTIRHQVLINKLEKIENLLLLLIIILTFIVMKIFN